MSSNKEIISNGQGALLVLNFLWASAFLIMPAELAAKSGRDGWMVPLLITPLALINFWVIWRLHLFYPGQTIIRICQSVLGSWLGQGLAFLYLWFPLLLTALVVRNFADFVTVFMPETPSSVLNIGVLLLCAWLASEGLETLARVNQLFILIIFLTIFLAIIFTISDVDFQNLEPFLEHGPKPLVQGLISLWGFPFAEIIALSYLLVKLRNTAKAFWTISLGIIAGALGLFIGTFLTISTFGPHLASILTYPILSLDKYTLLGGFIERSEILSMNLLILSGFMKATLCYKGSLRFVQDFFQLPSYNPLLFPLGATVYSLSFLLYRDIVHQISFASNVWPYYALTFSLVIPSGLLLLAYWKKKKGKKGNKQAGKKSYQFRRNTEKGKIKPQDA